MLLLALAYAGGVLTIISPCILPVLPFVFARADKPFATSGLPLLLGMAATFVVVATVAAVAGGWVAHANEAGRWIAIAVLAVFGVTLLFPSVADRLTRPLVAAGARLSESAGGVDQRSALPSFLLGIATGLLWAPCAGPILGLILTGAALNGASVETSLLLLAYALGAATSLAVALLIGGKVFAAMKRSLGAGEWIRKGLGVAVLVSVVAILFGADTGFLTRLSLGSTSELEQGLIDKLGQQQAEAGGGAMSMSMKGDNSAMSMKMQAKPAAPPAPAAEPTAPPMPPLDGATAWLNSPPLTREGLKGKVVLIDFWTYSCINCLRAIPYVKAWAEKYKDKGLVVIGVHTPEFAFERSVDNVKKAVADLGITYPVAVDSDYAIWRAFQNEYWPAHYFIDAEGRVRHHHFGEGEYEESERIIQKLLAEAGRKDVDTAVVGVSAPLVTSGAEMAADARDLKSPETYLGYGRAENFASPEQVAQEIDRMYSVPQSLALNQWALDGTWNIHDERATLVQPGGRIVYRFHARDLHLVLGTKDGKPVRYKVLIDGKPPGDAHGSDTDADGNGTVDSHRLYQLVRQKGAVQDRTFEIQFLDPGVEAFAFTFG
ncbi:MAG TPA: cytochrome c biogenesis protein DipZ [Reyranella sp.]|nr:cytochrome c biogenesis protein DipZ [Reyranella sp.]